MLPPALSVTTPLAMAAMFQLTAPVTQDALLAEMTRLRSTFPADVANEPEEEENFERVLSILVLRELLTQNADGYAIADVELAAFYANSLRPHLDDKALAAIPEPLLPEAIKT